MVGEAAVKPTNDRPPPRPTPGRRAASSSARRVDLRVVTDPQVLAARSNPVTAGAPPQRRSARPPPRRKRRQASHPAWTSTRARPHRAAIVVALLALVLALPRLLTGAQAPRPAVSPAATPLATVRAAIGPAAPRVDARTAIALDGLSYRVVSVTAAVEIALPTGELLRARGVFEIVKLRLGNLTRQPRLIGPAVIHLEVGGALIAPSTPVGAALVGSGWRPLRLQSLSAGHSAVRKLFYDLAPGAHGRPLALRIGHLGASRPYGSVRLQAAR